MNRNSFAALVLILALAGCPKKKDAPPTSPEPTLAPTGPIVVEERESAIDAERGGRVELPNHARFEAAPRALEASASIKLTRAEGELYRLTSSGRGRVTGSISLSIPYEGPAEDLTAAALYDGTLLAPVRCRVDKANQAVIIEDPEIFCPAPEFRRARDAQAKGLRGTNIWYRLIQKVTLARELHRCVELPGHSFRILCFESIPRELAEFISTTLQKVYELYNVQYASEHGTPALSRYSPEKRMDVQVVKQDGVNGRYVPATFRGYMMIDADSARGKRDELAGTLYHEMFHAVQDTYCSMTLGALLAMWWYEATAEWAGLKGRGLTFQQMVRHEFDTYPYILSVPVQKSRDYMEGMAAYGVAPLIEHVDGMKPGHLKETLQGWATRSGALYSRLVEDGRLRDTYPDFARNAVLAALPEKHPWTDLYVHVAEEETRIFTPQTRSIGEPGQKIEHVKNPGDRSKERRTTTEVEPLTTRFFRVHAEKLKEGRGLDARLLRDGRPSDEAWIITTAKQQSRTQRLTSGIGSLRGLGTDLEDVWIAVFNADPEASHTFDLSLTVKPASPRRWIIDPIQQEGHMLSFTLRSDPPVREKSAAKWAVLILTVNGRSYTSYGRVDQNGGSFPWPDPAVNPGKNAYHAETRIFGETAALDTEYELRLSTPYYTEEIARLKKDIDNKRRGADAYIDLGIAHSYLHQRTEAREAYEKARRLLPGKDSEIREKLAVLCFQEADLDGFVKALGGEDHKYARSLRRRMAEWAMWWMNDLGRARDYWNRLKKERSHDGIRIGESEEIPGPDEEIMK